MVDLVRPTCWENEAEWTLVYDLLFGSNDAKCKIEGLRLIDLWRSRSEAKVPVAVDCTACLIGAITVDDSLASLLTNAATGSSRDEMLRRLALAMALVRFVNGMADQAQKGVYARSVQTIAEEIDIPDWLVDLRHDATHASLPSLELLETGCHVALKWLKLHYWEQTLQLFNEQKSLAATDEFIDLLHQYLYDHWPMKRPEDKFFLSFCEKMKGMTSTDTIRNHIIPCLLRRGILLPSQIQIEEIESRGFQEPLEKLVEFWKPLILWFQEKNSQFITLLTDSLLKHFEDNGCECETRRFLSQFISTFAKHLQLDCDDGKLSCRILKYCLFDPSSDSNHLLSDIKDIIGISNSNEMNVRMLRDAILRYEDVFTKHCLLGDSQITIDYSRLREYFAVMPIDNVNLNSLLPDVSELQTDVLSSWSAATGTSWSTIQEGRTLHYFESLSDSSVNSNLLRLPDNIDGAIANALRVSSESEADFDVAFNTVASNKAEEHDMQYDEEQTAASLPYIPPIETEIHPSGDVCLF